MRMINLYNFSRVCLLATFILFSKPATAQSDSCAAATALTVGTTCTTTAYNVATAFTNSTTEAPNPCSGTSYRDGWYTFTTDASTTYITIDGTSNRIMGLALYSGACGSGTLAPVSCNVPGTANASLTSVAVSPTTTYRLRIMRTNNANANDMTGTICVYKVVPGYCASTSTSSSYYINNFTTTGGVSNVSNVTGYSAGGYGDYTVQTVSQYAGQQVNYSAVYTGGTFGFGIWIDWNNDFDFSDAGETMYLSTAYSSSNTGAFTVPAGAAVGSYRMRIRADFLATSPSPCGSITDGETEDYTFNVPTPPACASYPAALTTTALGSTTATISWTAASPAPANGYEYYISTSATTPTTGTTPTGTTSAGVTSANLTGLTANTTYYFWVRSNCNGTDKGLWAGSGTFFTGYCSSTSTSSSYFINNFTTSAGVSNITNATGYSAGGYGNFTAQSVSQYAGQSVSFSSAYTGGTFGFGIWIDWNNDLDFSDAGETMYLSSSYNSSNTGSFVVPGGTSAGSYRMRIRADFLATSPAACGVITDGETEDYTFIVPTPPACASYPSALVTTALGTTTATISWTAASPAPANGYEYYVSTSATTPTAGTTPTGSVGAGVTSANLTGLSANTTYYFWVRSNCNGTDKGLWTGSGTFFTGYCASTSTSTFYYINKFTTSGGTLNISNVGSGYSTGGYGNFTGQIVSQVAGGNISFNAVFYDGSTYTYGFNIWVDWNNDLDFSDPGELVYASGSYTTSSTGTFNVPPAAATGNYRMRIRADYLSTNPVACGSITDGETEDYTLNVATPLPCAGNPSSVTASITSSNSVTISWVAASPAPANGYQYYYSTSSTDPVAATAPSGSVGAGVLSATLTPLTTGTTYYFWVRSNCGGALGQGFWIGPINFRIPTCGVGNSTGTTTLGCPSLVAGGLGLNGADPPPVTCASSGCVDLEATYLSLGDTSSYTVSSIPYAPPYQFNCLKNPVSVNDDDVWSPTINLPFNFCFFGNPYTQCLMSSNGVITFDMTNNAPGGYSGWSFASNLPSTSLFRNSIFGVYHDIDPRVGGEVGWELITLNTGCRALVAAWSNIPMFSTTCNSQLYSGMVVLYENTNVIDVYIKEKNVCSTWNDGNAIVGLQNAAGTTAYVPANRNGLDANWTTTNEAWRFTPAGPSIATVKWYEGVGTGGLVAGTGNTLHVCPSATTPYTAEVTYTLCNGAKVKKSGTTTVTVTGSKTWNGSINTDWNTGANWTPAGVPTAMDCVVIPNVTNDPIISGTAYDAYAYSLQILAGGYLTLNPANNLTVTNAVNVDTGGQFDIKNSGSLLQTNGISNVGTVNMQRITPPLYRFDYEYWNSPMTIDSNYTLGMLSQNLTQFDKYYHWTPSISGGNGDWAQESAATVMDPARGYIIRAPNSFSFTPTVFTPYTATFSGTPNNGAMSCPISYGSLGAGSVNDKWNLIGNPYPSGVSGPSFVSANSGVILGTLYFWTHNSAISQVYPDPFYGDFVLNYNASDYASWNSTGGVAATTGGPVPTGYIAAGQSFFVQSKGVPGNATFNNTMRVKNNNTQFFRPGAHPHHGQSNNGGNSNPGERIWLNLTDGSSAFSQTLVGYVNDATFDFDDLYDGPSMDSGTLSFYSVLDNRKLVIQGRPLPFDLHDQVPLGFRSTANGDFSVRIDHFDNAFNNRNIYLEDKYLHVIHDLKATPYNFQVTQGTFDDRFILRFTDHPEISKKHLPDAGMAAFIRNEKISVNANAGINEILVYDVSGKRVQSYNAEGRFDFTGDFPYANGVYLARIKLSNGAIENRKLIK